MLRSIGRTDFTVAPGRGDGASGGGGPDPRDPTFPKGRVLASRPYGTAAEHGEIMRIRSHDFH
jgi:error-prone DNA polymerase